MKKFLSISIMLFSATLFAQKPIEIKVWPNGAPNSNGITTAEKQIDESRVSDVTVPTLTIYRAAKPNGMAIVACPGGGYVRLATAHEGHAMAAWFNAQGITFAVLKYRMPNTHHDVPLSDALQAIRIMKQHADDWGYNKVGILGASAGGHLASTAATHFDAETRPDFQILFYPVITMGEYTHQGSKNLLLGKNPSEELVKLYSNELQVNEQTPPAFIMHSSDDKAVPVQNSINYCLAMCKYNVPVSMHFYPVGGHGWGYNESFPYKPQWKSEMEKWLKELL